MVSALARATAFKPTIVDIVRVADTDNVVRSRVVLSMRLRKLEVRKGKVWVIKGIM